MTDDLEPLDERWKESAREYHDFRRKAGPRQRPNAAARSAPKRNGKPAAAARPSPKTVDSLQRLDHLPAGVDIQMQLV